MKSCQPRTLGQMCVASDSCFVDNQVTGEVASQPQRLCQHPTQQPEPMDENHVLCNGSGSGSHMSASDTTTSPKTAPIHDNSYCTDYLMD